MKTITSSYYKRTHGIIIVYDVTDRGSFKAVDHCLDVIDKYADFASKILVANKCDLIEERKVSFEEGKVLSFTFRALQTDST